MISFKSILPLCGLLIAGCSVGPDFHVPDNKLPDQWSFRKDKNAQPANPADITHWWRKFNDPQLNSLVAQAVSANLDVKQAAARLRQARAERQSAVSSFWPWLSASGSEQESHVGGSGAASGSSGSYHGGISAAWELDIFGGNRRNVESADARLAGAAADLDAIRLGMAAEAALSYCQLRAIQEQIAVSRSNLITQQHSADITQERRKAGFASDLDVANATAQVASTQAQIPTLETSASQSMHALAVLVGRPPADLVHLLSARRPVPTACAAVPTGIPSDLLRRRPDVRRAEASAHSATAQIGVAIANLFPKFSLNGSINQQSAKLSDWLSPSSRVTSFGPSFNWALFQAGNIQANIRVQKALRDEAVLAYRKTVLVALQEVEDSMIAGTNEHKRRALLSEAVTANRRAVELSVKLYSAGQTDFLNVLNAQRSLLQSENEVSQSNLALAGDMISLYKALGGGW